MDKKIKPIDEIVKILHRAILRYIALNPVAKTQ